MTTAKVFENGRSQAVRLPKEFRFSEDEVFVNNHFNDLEYEYNKVMSTIDEYNSLNQDRFTVMDLPH